jgi:hypothetical protein
MEAREDADLPFSCRRACQLSHLLFGGVRFDEGGDPVVQFADAIVSSTSLTSKGGVKQSKRNCYFPGSTASRSGTNAPPAASGASLPAGTRPPSGAEGCRYLNGHIGAALW